jgi:hypothetical protein
MSWLAESGLTGVRIETVVVRIVMRLQDRDYCFGEAFSVFSYSWACFAVASFRWDGIDGFRFNVGTRCSSLLADKKIN